VSSPLLFDEAPIAFSPTLARRIGLHEAILLQQIHYWLHHKSRDPGRYQDYYINGRFWVKWNMQEMMAHVPLGRSADPYKRTIKLLKEQSILLVAQHWKSRYINTNFYSIDYSNLELLIKKNASDTTGGNATEPDVDSPLKDEMESSQTASSTSTDLLTKNSSDIEDSRIPPPLDVSDLPKSIREAAAELATKSNNPQDYIDLLTARLRRNRELPVEQQIQQPLAWLKKVIHNEKKPDFSPAWKIQEERNSAKAFRNSPKQLEAPEDERPDVPSALASIKDVDLSIREAWIEQHLSKLIFSNARDQVRKAVLEGAPPSTRLGGILLVRFVNLAKGESK
jgi:hypothetical protein